MNDLSLEKIKTMRTQYLSGITLIEILEKQNASGLHILELMDYVAAAFAIDRLYAGCVKFAACLEQGSE